MTDASARLPRRIFGKRLETDLAALLVAAISDRSPDTTQQVRAFEREAAWYYMHRRRGEKDYEPRLDPVPPVASRLGDVRKAKARASRAASAVSAALDEGQVPRKQLRALVDNLARLRTLYSPHLAGTVEAIFAEVESVAAAFAECRRTTTPELRARTDAALAALAPFVVPAPVKAKGKRRRPFDGARLTLAVNIANIFRRTGVPLSRGRKGVLYLTLSAILECIDGEAPKDLFPLVKRAVFLSETVEEAESSFAELRDAEWLV